jgi:hypothetical protein
MEMQEFFPTGVPTACNPKDLRRIALSPRIGVFGARPPSA